MSVWNAQNYLQFANERTQPSVDLVARIALDAPQHIVDLGCGPGNSTAILRQRWPAAHIVGVDTSPEMLAQARPSDPSVTWVQADLTTWTPNAPFDLMFSNATLHWLHDHAALFPRLLAHVAPGGAFAVQIPSQPRSLVHQLLRETSHDLAWNDRMEAARATFTVRSPSFYYDALQPLAAHLDIWETEYQHVVADHQAMIEWFRATGLRPYLAPLNDHERQRFEAQLRERYAATFPTQRDGRVLFPFRRLFLVAYRSATLNAAGEVF